MAEPATFGPWWLGAVDDFSGEWHSGRFRELALQLASAFLNPDGQRIEHPSMLAHINTGADGEPLDLNEWRAVQRAIHFTVLDSNPPWDGGDGNEGFGTSSSDNSDILIWPLDLEHGHIALTRGSMVRIQAGGLSISEDLEIPAPRELWLPWPRPLDQEMLNAIYAVLTDTSLGDRRLADRIGVAIDWLVHAWRNSPSITFEHRIVMLKTAFDALTGFDKTHLAAAWIADRFASLAEAGVTDELSDDLLWSPSEAPKRTRIWGNGNREACTDLVHWFHVLGHARNQIVHEGSAGRLAYAADGSAYEGPLANIGERLLRETICVCLREFGFDDLWQTQNLRAIKRALEESGGCPSPGGQ